MCCFMYHCASQHKYVVEPLSLSLPRVAMETITKNCLFFYQLHSDVQTDPT